MNMRIERNNALILVETSYSIKTTVTLINSEEETIELATVRDKVEDVTYHRNGDIEIVIGEYDSRKTRIIINDRQIMVLGPRNDTKIYTLEGKEAYPSTSSKTEEPADAILRNIADLVSSVLEAKR